MRIVLFDIDCLRPDHMGCYGYDRPTSPAIDAIADQGTCFDRYYCASSPCMPSRMGFASGRFGINNGVVSNTGAGARFRIHNRKYVGPEPSNDMLMRRLRAAGCDTISFSNFADRHNAMYYQCGWSEAHTINLKGGDETAPEVTAPVLRWLKHSATRENYLLHINYWDTHRTYRVEPSWAQRFREYPVAIPWPDEAAIGAHQEVTGPFTATGQFEGNASTVPLMPGAIRNRADFEQMVTAYDAAIAYVDHHVGIVLDELDRQGVLDEAAVFITSDHGDAFGEHGIYSDHVCADECIHRVPLVVRWPGVTDAAVHRDSMLYNVDLSATLCELIGAQIPEEWDGQSFAAILRGEPGLDREYLVWDTALYTVQRAVRTRRHLMVRTYDDCGYRSFGREELYDMDADPYQTRNLIAECPEVAARCDRHLAEWLAEQKAKPGFQGDPLDCVLAERRERRQR